MKNRKNSELIKNISAMRTMLKKKQRIYKKTSLKTLKFLGESYAGGKLSKNNFFQTVLIFICIKHGSNRGLFKFLNKYTSHRYA